MPHITKHKTYFIFGRKILYIKICIQIWSFFFTSLCRFALLLFHSNLECRIDWVFFASRSFCFCKNTHLIKIKTLPNINTYAHTDTHTRMETRKTQIKWTKKNRWTCSLFEIQNYDLYFIVVIAAAVAATSVAVAAIFNGLFYSQLTS